MADKIVVMNSGDIEQAGPPLELYDRPANLFVAGFIGSPGDEHAGRRRSATAASVPATALTGRCRRRRRDGAGRRSSMAFAPSICASIQQGIPATVLIVEPTGSETQVHDARRRASADRRLPRAHFGAARRDAPHRARSGAHAFVRKTAPACASDARIETNTEEGGTTMAQIITRRDALRLGAEAAAALACGGRGRGPHPARRRARRRTCRSRRAPRCACCGRCVSCSRTRTMFRANCAKFQQATGVEVRVDFVGWEDIAPADRGHRQHRRRPRHHHRLSTRTRTSTPTSWSSCPTSPSTSARDTAAGLPRAEVRQEATAPTTGSACRSAARGGPLVWRKSAVNEAGFEGSPTTTPSFSISAAG